MDMRTREIICCCLLIAASTTSSQQQIQYPYGVPLLQQQTEERLLANQPKPLNYPNFNWPYVATPNGYDTYSQTHNNYGHPAHVQNLPNYPQPSNFFLENNLQTSDVNNAQRYNIGHELLYKEANSINAISQSANIETHKPISSYDRLFERYVRKYPRRLLPIYYSVEPDNGDELYN